MDKPHIAVLGLGYVGLPVAVAFAEYFSVTGFDIKQSRVSALNDGFDETGEVSHDALLNSQLTFTANESDLASCDFYIVAVPTPIDEAKQPDLRLLKSASETVGRHLSKGDIVVFESTVYPGVTEEFCRHYLEKESGLKASEDFFIGYSPERINPGDKEHGFSQIKKVVSADTDECLEKIAKIYEQVVDAGIFKAPSIKVAEAAKVIENTQRDINIAFINELAMICGRLEISVYDVLEAANTKWNFLDFKPGLVGGHCIGVDPYYLTHLAERLDYHPDVILSGRRINDRMGHYIAELTIKSMIKEGMNIQRAKVGVLGFAFKEDCPDVRNTRVIDIVNELESYQVKSFVYDPMVNRQDTYREYGLELSERDALNEVDVVIIAVAHRCFLSDDIEQLLSEKALIIDVKNMLKNHDGYQRVVSL